MNGMEQFESSNQRFADLEAGNRTTVRTVTTGRRSEYTRPQQRLVSRPMVSTAVELALAEQRELVTRYLTTGDNVVTGPDDRRSSNIMARVQPGDLP